jgi:phosphatidylinositol dimannoside acyltransferase
MPSRALRAFQLGSTVVRALPRPVANVLGRMAAGVAIPIAGGRRAQVERNLRRVRGPHLGGLALRRDVIATFESYARYYVDSFRLPGTPAEEIEAGITVDGWDKVDAALDNTEGTGVILALPHLGGWEWAGFWVSACRGRELTVVVEALEPRDLYDWFVELRRSFGMHVVPLGPGVAGSVLAALRAGHVVCLLCDRDLDGSGIEVDFFGERTTLPAGPATLALRSGAAVFPAAVYFEGDRHHAVVRDALDASRTGRFRDDVARMTQDLAGELEHLIRAAPEQWHLLQPNWPSDLDPEAKLQGRT